MKRIKWIEDKSQGIVGPARIGWVDVQRRGKRFVYRGRVFLSLGGRGFKANVFDVETGEHWWITGCRRDGLDALYTTDVVVDEDAREEYWTTVRGLPERVGVGSFRAPGKHSGKRGRR